MNVLVTGGAGLSGSHVVDQLLHSGYDVRVLDNLEKPNHLHGKPNWISPEVEFIEGDMRSEQDLIKALDGVDMPPLLHCRTSRKNDSSNRNARRIRIRLRIAP